jgi:calcineurin-like phosphoesterase family protein
MVKTFATADLHFNHGNIIKYCGRPFIDRIDMNNCLVDNWNKTVSVDDTVFHIGDFCFNRIVDGVYQGSDYWRGILNGNIIFLAGNHDRHLAIKALTIYYSDEPILMQHYPVYKADGLPPGIHYVLCGHIHHKWSRKSVDNVEIVNVGVDVSDFKPIRLSDIIK